MNDLIHDELIEVLGDWNAGKPIRSIALGHPVRWNEKTKEHEPHIFRQKKALAYTFTLIEHALPHWPIPFEVFVMLDDLAPAELSAEERVAAESLAWKALSRGWKSATSGFPDSHYISLKREDA